MEKTEKTNVMRVLDSKKISYVSHHLEITEAISGEEMARQLGQDPARTFKTLATQGASKTIYIFMIPVAMTLNLKKAAKAVGEKSVEMLKSKDLLNTVGYVHGATSPIGTKKRFRTTVHITAKDYPTVMFSGGKIGYQVELPMEEVRKVVDFTYCDIADE